MPLYPLVFLYHHQHLLSKLWKISYLKNYWDHRPLTDFWRVGRGISRKLEEGRFVQFDPIRAIKENTPKVRKLVMSAEEYYRRYGTQTNQEGWVRTFLKDQQETIYVKQILN